MELDHLVLLRTEEKGKEIFFLWEILFEGTLLLVWAHQDRASKSTLSAELSKGAYSSATKMDQTGWSVPACRKGSHEEGIEHPPLSAHFYFSGGSAYLMILFLMI